MIQKLYDKLLRPYLPDKYFRSYGIAIPKGKILDFTTDIEYKPNCVDIIDTYIESNSTVIEIGTGYGIFTIVALRNDIKWIETYEMDMERANLAREMFEFIGYDNLYVINEKFKPQNIDTYDYLISDNEGLEHKLLDYKLPNNVFIETHPEFGYSTEYTIDTLREKGYTIIEKQKMDMREDYNKVFLYGVKK